jgi:hypothetical protein
VKLFCDVCWELLLDYQAPEVEEPDLGCEVLVEVPGDMWASAVDAHEAVCSRPADDPGAAADRVWSISVDQAAGL